MKRVVNNVSQVIDNWSGRLAYQVRVRNILAFQWRDIINPSIVTQ